jgi:hypothetical protein
MVVVGGVVGVVGVAVVSDGEDDALQAAGVSAKARRF